MRLYKLSADQGNDQAQNNLGAAYLRGSGGLTRDETEAVRLYKLSAEHRNALAQANLGLAYLRGLGGLPKDVVEAVRFFKMSAEGGNAQGQANLAAAYERGDGGLVKDEREAVRLYRLAADHGNGFAQAALARLSMVRPAASPITTEQSVGEVRVRMVSGNGTFHVPVLINDTLKLNFVVDSGASDVSIPANVARTLMSTGTINESDFTGSANHRLADGSIVSSRTFIIRSLTVGDRTVTNVRASIARANAHLLLGQSFLNRFRSWSQDNVSHELVLQ